MSLRHHREGSYDPDSPYLFDSVKSLRQDKETLKAALQSALGTRDELRDCLEDTEERCRALERNNALIRREYEAAMQRAELARQDLIRLRDDDKRVISQLAERTKALEDLGKRHSSMRNHPADPSISEGIEQYAKFILERLKTQPELSSLFRERAHSSDRFWARIQAHHYDICLFRLLQFLSDLLVSFSTPKQVSTAKSTSVSCQTVVEAGTNTDIAGGSGKERWSEVPAVMLNSTTSSSHEETQSYPLKGKDDYERLMGESEQLLNSLHMQSDRLTRLNAHVQETMRVTSPRSALGSSLRYSAISPTATASNVNPLSPQAQDFIEDSPKQEEIPHIDPVPDILASPIDLQDPPKSLRKQRPRPKKPYQPAPNKTDVGTM